MRAAIVGCGFTAETHLRAPRRVGDAQIVAACDRGAERAAVLARTHRIPRAFDSVARMIAEARPDVVHVLTPPDAHCEVAIQAISAGCYVLVEKPMAMSVLEASRMLEVSEQQNVRLGVCHNFRFVAAFLKARALLERDVLGESIVVALDQMWRAQEKETAATCAQSSTP